MTTDTTTPEPRHAARCATAPHPPRALTPIGDDLGLLIDAATSVIGRQSAAVYLLQRHIRVGFAKAGLLMNLLEERGIISPAKAFTRDRVVLVARERLDETVAALRQEADGEG